MIQLGLMEGLPEDPQFWYDAVVRGQGKRPRSETRTFAVLADDYQSALQLAEKTCDEGETVEGVYKQGTIEEYREWMNYSDEMDDFDWNEEVCPGPNSGDE